ncbi:MAG: oxidoreductase [Verrucomicrobia bacterium]|nr:oxidoreductase [Verrucomicrobiota bacterium]
MRLGIVDLDTSHPAAWIPLERKLGHEIVAVWDGGSVHPRSYVDAFAVEHDIPRVCDDLNDMVDGVDAVVIHGCDWDTHVPKARPFVEAGKAVLIDKPLAGKVADLRQIAEWIRQGARITGGSALRFAGALRTWQSLPREQRGTPHTAFCGCGVDDFNYGIHAYSLLSGIMGEGMTSVRHVGTAGQRRIQVSWGDDRRGFLAIGKQDAWIPFHASVVTEKTVVQFIPDPLELYAAILQSCLPYLAGEVTDAPVGADALIEPELAAIAARASWRVGDREIFLRQLAPNDGYDGAAFAAEYRRAKYPSDAAVTVQR